jgi:ferredoxin
MSLNFVQKKNLFSYTGSECLRNEYYHNDCRICIDLCPENAFNIIRNKLTLFDNECIECGACVGSCPSEALHMESFDPNAYTMLFKEKEDGKISCKGDSICLGTFDAHHYITMALRSPIMPQCDMSYCEGCTINKEGKVEAQIRSKIATANAFFEKVGYEAQIETIEEKPEENSRRTLFKKAFDHAKDQITEGEDENGISVTMQNKRRADTDTPLKLTLLKNALKEKAGSFTSSRIDDGLGLLFNKHIVFEACTNCGECVQFCPTHALTATPDKQGIMFTAGNCIGCRICNDICKVDAVVNVDEIDLVSLAFDRTEQLVHYEMVQCHECRCPYPYRGGDPICDRCKGFKDDFGDMMTLAKDM